MPKNNSLDFISNNQIINTNVLKTIQEELLLSESFSLSVAFITLEGITMLLEEFKEIRRKGVKGRILTSTYQFFNKPEVFRRLLDFDFLDVRIYSESVHHTKGYIFSQEKEDIIIIGSSNLTSNALKLNREWNLKFKSSEHPSVQNDVINEFEEMWNKADILNDSWINEYEELYKLNYQNPKSLVLEKIIVPNNMQESALRNLEYLRKKDKKKALLISATGTGKTYLAAFDVKNTNAEKVLFVIHREQIARDALNSFRKVMPNKSFGLLTGNYNEINKDIIFTTIQTLSKDNVLHKFPKNYFDYIIFDEAHHLGANTHLKAFDYFEPKFTLGMSATPERTDGFNVYELFDYNIAYEIRLQEALEEDMLAPFHYFGVSDILLEEKDITLSSLTSNDRIDLIYDNLKYYGHGGDTLRGLIFCSRRDEAIRLSDLLNLKGLKTIPLTGEDSQDKRAETVKLLNDGLIDYIITVDIFNEGVDIPKVNQVVMLRPTQSAIIFVQQLGRGLRKSENKDFVVIVDFIGNYNKNFLIPIALSGDQSHSPNQLKKFMMNASQNLPGVSTINFDKISKDRIYTQLDKAVFTHRQYLKEVYTQLKFKLGRVPKLVDYLDNNTLDPQVIFNNQSYKNYNDFLLKVDKDYNVVLSEEQNQALMFVSKEFSSGKRNAEIKTLLTLIDNDIKIEDMIKNYNEDVSKSIISYLNKDFLVSLERRKYDKLNIIDIKNNVISYSEDMKLFLESDSFKSLYLDLLEYANKHYELYYKEQDDLGFVIGEQYTKKEVSWILNYETNRMGTMFGYTIEHKTKTIPLFVTYHKDEEIDESIKYDDYFVNESTFNWMSRNRRTLESDEIKSIVSAKENGYDILLFVKRDDGEKSIFYYIGQLDVDSFKETEILSNGEYLPIVNFTYKLKNPVRDDLFTYLTSE